MNTRRVWKRDLIFAIVLFLERNDLPGAWRVRAWFEGQTYNFPNRSVVCSTKHGFKMVLEPFDDNGVEKSIFQTGTYESGTLAVIQSILKEGDHFIDVGANVGLMTLVAARAVGPTGRVDSFEPLSEIRDLLSKSIEINNVHNIHVHGHALGSAPGAMNIYRHPEVNRGSASIAWSSTEDLKTEIMIDTLDHALLQVSARTVSMIKIDVEGWELEVVKGGQETFTKNPKPVVCIEFSRTRPLYGGTLEEMFQLMQSFGYIGYVLENSKSTVSRLRQIDVSGLPNHDNVFFIPASRVKDLDERIFTIN